LQIVETEANAIRIALRSLLNPRMTMDQRERQYANIEQSRRNYQEAWDTYAPLPQTPEEARLWEEFVVAWEAWAEVNNEFMNASRGIEESEIVNTDEYVGRITGFIGDHHALMGQVANYLLTGETFTGGGDPTACNFGQWCTGAVYRGCRNRTRGCSCNGAGVDPHAGDHQTGVSGGYLRPGAIGG